MNFGFRISDRGMKRRAFTFTEVMFAVMILGLGFIMVAALFPVGIAQTKANTEETASSSLGRHGVAVVQSRFAAGGLGSPGLVSAVPWNTLPGIAGDVIDTSDPRFAWTALYNRANGSRLAYVYVFGLAVRNTEIFTRADVQTFGGGQVSNLQPRPVKVAVTHGSPSQVKVMALPSLGAAHQDNWKAADANAYLVVANSGRIYRLGTLVNQTSSSATYELIPGNTTVSSLEDITESADAQGWLVGRGYADPNSPTGGYAGASMATGVQVGVITVE